MTQYTNPDSPPLCALEDAVPVSAATVNLISGFCGSFNEASGSGIDLVAALDPTRTMNQTLDV